MRGVKTQEGRWLFADGRQILNKAISREILIKLHQEARWRTQALCDQVLRTYCCVGVYTVAKQVTEQCLICQKINKKVMRKTHSGGRTLVLRPFQNIEVHYIELPKVQQ